MQPAFRRASSLYIYMPLDFSGQDVYIHHNSAYPGSVGNVMPLCHLRYVGRVGNSRYLAYDGLGPCQIHR